MMKRKTIVGVTIVILATLVMWLCIGLAWIALDDWKLKLVSICLVPVGIGVGLLIAELKRSK